MVDGGLDGVFREHGGRGRGAGGAGNAPNLVAVCERDRLSSGGRAVRRRLRFPERALSAPCAPPPRRRGSNRGPRGQARAAPDRAQMSAKAPWLDYRERGSRNATRFMKWLALRCGRRAARLLL